MNLKRILVLIMTLAMVIGACAPAIQAFDGVIDGENAESKKELVYVSLGDSMSNGYGLDGYDAESGVYDYGHDAYTNVFAELLGKVHNANVTHHQLACSAMRPEDINFLLRLDYDDPEVIALLDRYPEDDLVCWSCGDHEGVAYEDIVYCAVCKWDPKLNPQFDLPGWGVQRDDGKSVDDYEAWWTLVQGKKWNDLIGYGDFWTWKELVEDYRFGTAATYIKSVYGTDAEKARALELMASKPAKPRDDGSNGEETAYVAKHYQEAVKNADVISFAIGNGNFGVWLMGRITTAIMDYDGIAANGVYDINEALALCSDDVRELIETTLAKIDPMIDKYVGTMMGDLDADKRESVKNVATYAVVSFMINYKSALDRILELNPDVEIVMPGLMNTYAGDDVLAEEGTVTIGMILDNLFPHLNAYIAALPTLMQAKGNELWANAKFYYAEEYTIECLIHNFGDEDFMNWKGVARERFVTGIVGECDCGNNCTDIRACEDFDSGLFWDMLEGNDMQGVTIVRVSKDEIAAYDAMTDAERAAYAVDNKDMAASIGIYLALEDAICQSGRLAPVTLSTLTGLSLDASLLGPALDNFNDLLPVDIVAFNDIAIETLTNKVNEFIAGEGLDFAFTVDQVKAVIDEEDEGEKIAMITYTMKMAGINVPYEVADELAYYMDQNRVNDLSMVLTLPTTLSNALWQDADLCSMLAVVARNKLGNGLGAHPSVNGHKALAEAMCDAYVNDWTAQKQTIVNAYNYTLEYYDEAYAFGYAYADANGYTNKAIRAIDKILARLDKVDLSDNTMTPAFRADLQRELDAMVPTLNELKEAIATDKAKDVPGLLDTIRALKDDLKTHLKNIYALCKQAGYDVAKLIVVPMVEELLAHVEELVNVIVDKMVEYIKPLLKGIYGELKDIVAIIIKLNLFLGGAFDGLVAVIEKVIDIYHFTYDLLIDIFGSIHNAAVITGKIVSLVIRFIVKTPGVLEDINNLFHNIYDIIVEVYGETHDAAVTAKAVYNYLVSVVKYINNTIKDAINGASEGDYVLNKDSYYVALGEAGYASVLADMLHLAEKDKFEQFGLDEDYVGALAGADLVTIKFNNGEFYNFAFEQMLKYLPTVLMSSEQFLVYYNQFPEISDALAENGIHLDAPVAGPDWSKYADEETRAILSERVNAVIADFASTDLPQTFTVNVAPVLNMMVELPGLTFEEVMVEFNVTDLIAYVAEVLVYGSLESASRILTTLDNVYAVAPNATVVITGIDNPLAPILPLLGNFAGAGKVLTMVDQLIEIINLPLYACAVVKSNTIFVQSDDAAVIYDALNVTCDHYYVNECTDTKCYNCGEVRVAPGHTFGEWVTVLEPTTEAEGKKEHTCTVCGHVESESIAKLPLVPGGGDDDDNKNDVNDTTPVEEKDGLSTAAIIGISVGSIALACGVGALVYWFFVKKKVVAAAASAATPDKKD